MGHARLPNCRRVIVPIIALAAALLSLPAPTVSAASPPTSPWSQGDGDAAHTRSNRAETGLTASAVSRLTLQGRIVAPRASHRRCKYFDVQDVALVGDNIYGIFGGQVSSYDAATRTLRWHTDADTHQQRLSVSVAGGLVVVGTATGPCGKHDTGEQFHSVTAYHADDGTVAWTQEAIAEVWDTVVADGVVLSSEKSDLGGGETFMQAWSLASGDLLWTRQTECTRFGKAVVVHDVAIYTRCAAQQHVIAADLQTGTPVWDRAFPDQTPTVQAGDSAGSDGQHVFVHVADQTMLELDPTSGSTQYTLGANAIMAVADYRAFTTEYGFITAYALGSRHRSWTIASDSTVGTAANGLLYLADGTIVSAYTGHLVTDTGVSGSGVLAVGDGREVVSPSGTRRLDLYGLPG